MSKQQKEESIASLKVQAVKVHYRYLMALVFIAGLALGAIGSYFVAIDLTAKAQASVVNSITLKAEQ